jgi:uncharacterized protein (TIGR02588 family)
MSKHEETEEPPGGESGAEADDETGPEEGGHGTRQPSRAEWIVGTVCSVVVLFAVAYLFYEGLTRPSLPAMIGVEVAGILPMTEGFLVEFTARNEGTRTAADLVVEGSLLRVDSVVETSTATLQFVPGRAERSGGLFFSKDPSEYRLEVRPTGFDQP